MAYTGLLFTEVTLHAPYLIDSNNLAYTHRYQRCVLTCSPGSCDFIRFFSLYIDQRPTFGRKIKATMNRNAICRTRFCLLFILKTQMRHNPALDRHEYAVCGLKLRIPPRRRRQTFTCKEDRVAASYKQTLLNETKQHSVLITRNNIRLVSNTSYRLNDIGN